MILRLLALVPLVALIALPLGVVPGPPVSVLALVAGVLGAAGALLPAPPLATAGAVFALLEYALALVMADAPPSAARALAMGLAIMLYLAATHLARHAAPATLGPGVLRAVLRRWLEALALGAAGTAALTLTGHTLAAGLRGAALPAVVIVAAAGAALTVAGVVGLILFRDEGAAAAP